jgi:hypothetical protein
LPGAVDVDVVVDVDVDVDDEIVDFTHKGGWDKIDTVLRKHSCIDIIFGNSGWECVMYWAEDIVSAAKVLKVSTSPLLHLEELTLATCLPGTPTRGG